MKKESAIKARILILEGEIRDLKHLAHLQREVRAYGEAAKYMQQESAIRDQIALLKWVLKD